MNPFEETLKSIDDFCSKNRISYSIIGGLALIFHKIQRTTNDIDITLLVKLENMENIGKILSEEFEPIFPDSIQFFQKNFVLPVSEKKTKMRIDFAAGLTGFDKKVIERSMRQDFGKLNLPFCTIEDLILYKLFASRPKDLSDIHEIAKRHKGKIDEKYLSKMLNDFSELEREDMSENFKRIFLKK